MMRACSLEADMAVFPAEEVERIINEEIVRGQGNTLWTKPQARRRYQKLLATLVLGKRARHDGLGDLLDSVFDAQYELSPYCSERERLFAFELDAGPAALGSPGAGARCHRPHAERSDPVAGRCRHAS